MFLRKVRVALTPRSSRLGAKLASGVRIWGRNRPGWGGRGIYVYREDLEPELSVLSKFLSPGAVFVDVGANVGVYSLSAAALVGPHGTVVSVEPFPQILAQLWENVSANDFGSIVRIRNFCASDITAPATLWLNHGRPHSFSLIRAGNAAGLSVLAVRLDDLLGWERLERLDYLKIDAEGSELGILNGAKSFIEGFRPIIQLEDVDRTLSRRLDEYTAFSVAGTRNSLLIPTERHGVADDLVREGWTPAE